jgi:hypothetical protein
VNPSEISRFFVPPLGKLRSWRFVTVEPSRRQARFIMANRYPRQIIGFAIRLPDGGRLNDRIPHYSLSIMWAEPARWWKQ